MKKEIYFLNENNIKNKGDYYSSPYLFFNFHPHKCYKRNINDFKNIKNKLIIIGGGGLLNHPSFSTYDIIKNNKSILWGCGTNNFTNKRDDFIKYIKNAEMIGIRDYVNKKLWIPCVSCMHKEFDKKRKIKNKIVIYEHYRYKIPINDFPKIDNYNKSLKEILDFIGSSEIVLTSSYHGVYWATLLEKKVIIFPWNSKFFYLKHKHPIVKMKKSIYNKKTNSHILQFDEWKSLLDKCKSYPNSLNECREKNNYFYKKILKKINKI